MADGAWTSGIHSWGLIMFLDGRLKKVGWTGRRTMRSRSYVCMSVCLYLCLPLSPTRFVRRFNGRALIKRGTSLFRIKCQRMPLDAASEGKEDRSSTLFTYRERERGGGGDTKEERGICAGRSNVSRHNKHVAAIVRAQGGYRSGQYADTREKGGGEVPPSLME